MQALYQRDKPFLDAFKTIFVITVYQASRIEILRKQSKNWTLSFHSINCPRLGST